MFHHFGSDGDYHLTIARTHGEPGDFEILWFQIWPQLRAFFQTAMKIQLFSAWEIPEIGDPQVTMVSIPSHGLMTMIWGYSAPLFRKPANEGLLLGRST